MVRRDTSLVIEASGTAGTWFGNPLEALATSAGIRADVTGALLPFMYVDAFTMTDRGALDLVEWDYRAALTVRPKSDYGSADDIASIVANAFYRATGKLPTVSVGAASQPALEPSPVFPGVDLLRGLQGTTTLLIVGIVVIIGLVAFGPALRIRASL